MNKWGFILFVAHCFLATIQSSVAAPRCERPWIYFDLGDTLVDTKTYADPTNHELRRIFYMRGARAYVADLYRKGYRTGLLVNVPGSWGSDNASRFAYLRRFVAERWYDWPPMDWSVFTQGVWTPPQDSLRKPNPYLFRLARVAAAQAGCEAIYEGEEQAEIDAANAAGLHGYLVGKPGRDFYLPEAKIQDFIHSR